MTTAAQVIEILQDRWANTDAHAWLTEVNNSTGARGGRQYADAIVCSCWPSRGLWLAGVEVKVARGDGLAARYRSGTALCHLRRVWGDGCDHQHESAFVRPTTRCALQRQASTVVKGVAVRSIRRWTYQSRSVPGVS